MSPTTSIPTGDTVVDDAGGAYPFSTGQPNYREFFYGAVGLAGESQGFDGNGPFVRFQAGGGPTLVPMPNPSHTLPRGAVALGAQHLAAAGHPPAASGQGLPPFRMDVPCYTQPVPDINGPAAALGPPTPKAVP